ncbi:hypothetical protein KSS87_014175, partial [Heliosperma pusillum]
IFSTYSSKTTYIHTPLLPHHLPPLLISFPTLLFSSLQDQLTMSTPKGLMVVVNRLPFTAVRNGPNSWLLQSNTAGGLVTALQGIKQESEMKWVGWAGVTVQDTLGQESLTKALAAEVY